MNKRDMFKVLSKSPRGEVIELGRLVTGSRDVVTVKKPVKTLILLKMRESVADSEFFLGELLACEAMVKLGGHTGFAVTMGDDYEKVFAMAVIDAAMNAGADEAGLLHEKLGRMRDTVAEKEKREFGRILKTKVDFRIMEDIV